MDANYFALGRPSPVLTVEQVRLSELWTTLKAELAGFYGQDMEHFGLIETSWDNDNEYAEVVTLDGRIVGALNRPLTQENVAAIWGVNRMEKRAFINRIRSLRHIDGDVLPELSREQQSEFLSDPVRFFLGADEAQSDAIMREIESRQNNAARHAEVSAQRAHDGKPESMRSIAAKAKRKKKSPARVVGQTELLLPITGGAGSSQVERGDVGKIAQQTRTASGRIAG